MIGTGLNTFLVDESGKNNHAYLQNNSNIDPEWAPS